MANDTSYNPTKDYAPGQSPGSSSDIPQSGPRTITIRNREDRSSRGSFKEMARDNKTAIAVGLGAVAAAAAIPFMLSARSKSVGKRSQGYNGTQERSDKHDIKVLNSLITTTIDSANGFEQSAKDATSQRFTSMFEDYARERREAVAKLQAKVRTFGGSPEDDGSFKAAGHRRWVDFKNAVTNSSDKKVVEEVERGEDYIKAKYEAALKDDRLSPEAASVISEVFDSVRAGHDRASALKQSFAANA